MHRIQLVHLDIKPDNVMLSPTFQRLVFIDYGLSKFIKERIGEKSLTHFIGSISFCSDEMACCFWKKKDSRIDLYYNDLFCLKDAAKSSLYSCQSINSD